MFFTVRKIHLYHCDHRGLPLALVNEDGTLAWHGEYDEWGNLLYEDNPHHLTQLLRLPGQQYDEESGLHYNRYRYYDPQQGRYITQDPVGLNGGWNPYIYPLDPVSFADPLGLLAFVIPAIIEGINWLYLTSAVAGSAVLAASGDSEQSKTEAEDTTLTCSPPSGTVCYFYDQVPPSAPHYPHAGSHYHLFKMGNAPYCIWNKYGSVDVAPPGSKQCPFPRKVGR